MRSRSIFGLGVVALLLAACIDSTDTSRVTGVGQVLLDRGGGSSKLPTCSGASDCAAGPFVCANEDQTTTVGPSIVTDYSAGVSSDGGGPYVQGSNGVVASLVGTIAILQFDKASKSIKHPRSLSVNLSSPVPGGGGVPLGTIADGNDNQIEVQWYTANNARQNLHNIPVGATVTANQMNVTFHINGHFHILQMGPLAYGHCHSAPTAVNGDGTSTGTISRVSDTKWVIDLPAGSIGRLFDLYNTDQYAVDKGLYYSQLHLEIGS